MNGSRDIWSIVKQSVVIVEQVTSGVRYLGEDEGVNCQVGECTAESARDSRKPDFRSGLFGLRSGMKHFWLVKQEPSSYSWSDFVADGETSWTGVRNFAARNNLRKMQKGDEVLFYHSGEDKAVIGIAKVTKPAYPDPTAKEGDWSTVDLAAVKPLRLRVALREIKGNSRLKEIPLVRQSRLSVMPLSEAEFREITSMGAG
jgi:predicted RNA-binding protein with PUA-like domain